MKRILCMILAMFLVAASTPFAYAKEGDNGYEGGIRGRQNPVKTTDYDYQEVVFLTGKPVVLKGTVSIKMKSSNDTETTTYTYNLSDSNKNLLKRTVSLVSKLTKKENNQTVKETTISGKPTEVVTISNKIYTLDTYDLSKSSIADSKAAVGYFAGDVNSRKVYKDKDGGTIVTVTTKGQFYGYSQNWSEGEVEMLDYFVQNDSTTPNASWSGTAKVKLASTSTTQLKYVENYPEEISFDGGYYQSQNISSKLHYETNMPEFDKDGLPLDKIAKKSGDLKLETFPTGKRLVSPDLSSIRGHWAEEDIRKLYSLEIFDEDLTLFIPDQYMTRAEFAKALARSINTLPQQKTKTTKSKKTTTKETSSYFDVQTTDPYFPYIQQLTAKKVLTGYDDGNFYPNDPITRAQAIVSFVKMLGLEGMSKDEYPVTIFKDNDDIPTWALRAIYAANKIGIAVGDNGYLRPNEYMTKAQAAAFINRVIDYMRKDMPKSYSDKILNY